MAKELATHKLTVTGPNLMGFCEHIQNDEPIDSMHVHMSNINYSPEVNLLSICLQVDSENGHLDLFIKRIADYVGVELLDKQQV